MSEIKQGEFQGWRSFLWPIHRRELPKLLPMFSMLFLICFCYGILRNLKDAIVICAGPNSGAEVIPFIKVWAMLPGAFIATWIYTRLSRKFSQEWVFYIMMGTITLCYLAFAFTIYPNRDALHPDGAADWLEGVLPLGCKGFIAMLRNWTFTVFYVICELWGCIVLPVLFWGFANQVTTVKEAKRFFGVCTIGGNLSAMASGQVSNIVTRIEYMPQFYGNSAWEQTIACLVIIVALASLLTMAIYRWLNVRVLGKECATRTIDPTSKKSKGSLRQSWSYIKQSRYLCYIAVMVVGYNLVINLVEVVFKDRLSALYPDTEQFLYCINQLTVAQGFVSTLMAISIAFLLSRWGWVRTALITPVSMLLTSIGFFGFLFLPDSLSMSMVTYVGITPLAMAALFGGMQNCLSKAAKYSVFDATKEMTFIPLPFDMKIQGKAAIDGIGSRLGKFGGSLIHQGLLLMCGTLLASAPYVGVFLLVVTVVWIYCTKALGRDFERLSAMPAGTATFEDIIADQDLEAPVAAEPVAT
jgi:AAA family ATP:ADP antiporter